MQLQSRKYWAKFRVIVMTMRIGLHALGLGFTGIRLRLDSHWDNRSLGQWNFVKYLAEKW